MRTFNTPEPITVHVEVGAGDLRIIASDRTDATVDVRPSDPHRKGDVTAAEQTRIDFSAGRLEVKSPKGWKHYTFWGRGESVAIVIEVPTGSTVRVDAGMAPIHCTGRLGDSQFRSGAGDIHIEEIGSCNVMTGAGEVTIDRAGGGTVVTTGTGGIRVGAANGTVSVKNANGDTWVGEAAGDVRVHAANGKITVDRAMAGVTAKSACGSLSFGEVRRGAVVAQTAYGSIEVGVLDGVAAWLDLDTKYGNVNNGLDAARPEPGEDTVEIRAGTAFGDITVRRSRPKAGAANGNGPTGSNAKAES